MVESYICLLPTNSGVVGGKCMAWFTDSPTTAQAFVDKRGYAGAAFHTVSLDNPFGQDYQSATSDAESSTTSSTMQDKVTMTTPALTGTYLINWQARLTNSQKNKPTDAQLYNDTDSAVISQTEHENEANVPTLYSGFGEVVFTGAAKTFKIQYCAPTTGTAKIDEARMTIWRVG